ncbi:SLC13 family permease [Thioclava litoralis]|uniref:SLC13 family permease n=1 Tax=Thioclava litoralis TaxID=3076557 RepID=A0ABZ1DZ97_9RHOB|nr:SLC13 family permease [Thioclava sp. FTW29]
MFRAKESILAIVILIAGWSLVALPMGMTGNQGLVAAIVLVTLVLWGTGLVPGYVASTFLFSTLILTGAAAPQLVFSSFASSAIWLVVTGFVIGAAISHGGLGARLGDLARPYLSRSYTALIAGLMVLGMALGFVMPSSLGRAAVLVPIGMALADALGLEKGTAGRTGVAITIAIGTNMPSFAILPSNIPNVILAGVAEASLGTHFGYGRYLLLHYPVLGLLKSVAIVALVLKFFPARITQGDAPHTVTSAAAGRQAALIAIFLVTLLLWSTDQLHGLNPAWIGLGTSLVLMIPQFGFVPPPVFRTSVDFSMLLFVAGALTLGTVVNASGLGALIAGGVFDALPFEEGADFLNFVSLCLLSVVTSIFTTMAGVPAVLTPLVPQLAKATGLSQEAVLMTQVIGFSSVLFPYQVGPLIVAMGLAGESTRPLLKVTLALFAITALILIPVDFLWWKFLGVL